MKSSPLLTIHTDGASRGNPGAAAYAYVIARDGAEPIEEAGCLGELTNNQAEYIALVRALKHALELGPQHSLLVNSDSELMVKQMKGEYRVKNLDLQPLYREASDLAKRFKGSVAFQHVRRALNSRADELCKQSALDGKRKPRRVRCTSVKPAPGSVHPLSPATPPKFLREEAVGYLRGAVLAWASGEDGPTPEEMWERLRQMLEQNGIRVSGLGSAQQ